MQIIKKNYTFFIVISFLLCIGIYICKIKGYGSDIDTYSLIKTFLGVIDDGNYSPSRYYGHPVPEILIGFLAYNFGSLITAFFCYSIFLTSLYFFYKSFSDSKSSNNIYFFLFLCVSNPILLFDNTNISDFQLAMFFFSSGIFCYKKKRKYFVPLLFGLSIGSRLSFTLFIILFFLHEYHFSDKKDKKEIIVQSAYSLFIGGLFYLNVFFQSHLNLSFIKNTGGPPLNLIDILPRFFYKIYYLIGKFSFIFIFLIFLLSFFKKKAIKIFSSSKFILTFILANLLVFLLIPSKTAILSISIIFLYLIIINNYQKKTLLIIIFLNFFSWVLSYEVIDIKYKNQKICDPIHAISAKIKFKVTSGEFLKMTKNNKNIIFCHSEQFNDQRSYKYLNGKKIK